MHILQSAVCSYKLIGRRSIAIVRESERERTCENVRAQPQFKNYLLFSITVLIYKPYPSM